MNKTIQTIVLVVALLVVAITPTFAQQGNIVDAAVANPEFSTLVAAVQAAGLVDTLANGGPFTVFAPTNGAFETLLADLGISAEQLLADRQLLTTVLTYHVVPGEFQAADILAQDFPFAAPTVQGENIIVDADPNSTRLRLNGGQATVAIPNLDVSNGVIHVIDNVLLPPSVVNANAPAMQPNIVEVAAQNGSFSILLAAAEAAGLVETLSGTQQLTVFAPTDAAFAQLLRDLNVTAEQLLADTDLLTTVLLYHVVPGEVKAADLIAAGSLSAQTVGGQSIAVTTSNGVTLNGNTNVVIADVDASNGVVHVIDRVLLPPNLG